MLFLAFQHLRALWIWIMNRRVRTVTIFLALLYPLHLLQGTLLGFGPTRLGGLLGRFIDNSIRRSLFESRAAAHRNRFLEEMGYKLPEIEDANKVGVHVLVNNGLAESLVRRKHRHTALQQYVRRLKKVDEGIIFPVIQPNIGDWHRPVQWKDDGFTVLEFDEEDVSEFMMEHFDSLYRTAYQRSDTSGRVQLFALAAVYQLGGVFVHPDITSASALFREATSLKGWTANATKDRPSLFLQSIDDRKISVLAAVPFHSTLKCAINQLLTTSSRRLDWTTAFQMVQHNHWDPTCKPQCCPLARLPSSETSDILQGITSEPEKSPVVNLMARFAVEITEPPGAQETEYTLRERCSHRLQRRSCSPGWLCHRCLRTGVAGNLHACRFVCRSCYSSTVCTPPSPKRIVPIQVQVTDQDPRQKRIPRIIHQTAIEPLTTARYPHFQRLQHSWKASGWDYRFYTDEDCIEFIRRSYPRQFLEAFQAIQPGAFKADLFRLLVLFKEGGIYADADVQLDTHLDNFVTKDLSFFVPRDVPVDYWPHSNYCLWNGLMGAAPGHFLLAKAIEDVINTIRNRVDYYDVEGRLCARDLQAEVWKLRVLPVLILTGPCALGMSINSALNTTNVLDGFDLGWLPTAGHENSGHGLLLLADRYDTGELRFTDLGRNLVVASTNQDRLARNPISLGVDTKRRSIHYSKSETDIVGEFHTYKDDLSAEETISLHVTATVAT